MSLPDLSNELQDLIIINLHLTAAIALSKTSHHYHSTIFLYRLVPETVWVFLYNREQSLRTPFGDGPTRELLFACFKCLCMKPDWQFSHSQVLDSYSMECCEECYDRQCVECDLRDGLVKPGDILHSGGWFVDCIVCTECSKTQRRFCRGCRTCASCLEKKGAEPRAACHWCDACVRLKSAE